MNEKTEKPTGLALLREPFPAHQISKLPKGTKAQNECPASEKVSCKVCGGWHHPKIIHLDYVGHAALTDRLLDADPMWFWEPLAMVDGLPRFDESGGLWIKLTVCGHTRLGYGHAAQSSFKDIGSREKEVIGDALRNAAMRFGAALDLWHKGDLHADDDDGNTAAAKPARWESPKVEALKAMTPEQLERLRKCTSSVFDHLNDDNNVEAACKTIDKEQFGAEEKVALWTYFDSKQRSAMKKWWEAHKKPLPQPEEAAQA